MVHRIQVDDKTIRLLLKKWNCKLMIVCNLKPVTDKLKIDVGQFFLCFISKQFKKRLEILACFS